MSNGAVGEVVGSKDVGEIVGDVVGSELVGEMEGDTVGSEMDDEWSVRWSGLRWSAGLLKTAPPKKNTMSKLPYVARCRAPRGQVTPDIAADLDGGS